MQNNGSQELFALQKRTNVVCGSNSIARVGALTRNLGAKKVLLVTDAGIIAAGHASHVEEQLKVSGLEVVLFDKVRENPTTKCVDDCVAVAKAAGVDTLVGLGGGSSMDTAKGCNFILTNGGRMQDYWGVGKATKPMLPFVAIPTTSGTGSELQSAALIADEQTHQKMACLDPKCAARVTILDPTLTLSQPPRVTACTGIDAIAHAVETAVTTKRTPLSDKFSHEAFRLCTAGFGRVLKNPDDLQARTWMQLGAALAGAAIEGSMLGAAHAAANPLTAHFDIVHGHAVGLMLPHVVRFNGSEESCRHVYARLARLADLAPPESDPVKSCEALANHLSGNLALANLPGSLSECGVKRDSIPALAQEAAKQWTVNFNPRQVTEKDFVRLYEAAY